MIRFKFVTLAWIAVLAESARGADPAKPHVIFILADDPPPSRSRSPRFSGRATPGPLQPR